MNHITQSQRTHFDIKTNTFYMHSGVKGTLVAHGWPDLRAWRKRKNTDKFYPHAPGVQFLDRHDFAAWFYGVGGWEDENRCRASTKDALNAYAKTFPEEVLKAVSVFPVHQWDLANLCIDERAIDLIKSNPALAMALATAWKFKRMEDHWSVIRSMLSRPRSEIAGWLGFPASDSSVKLLRKIPPDMCCQSVIATLRSFLKSQPKKDTINALRHIPQLSYDVFESLKPRFRHMLSGKQLAALAQGHRGFFSLIADTRRMAQQLGCPEWVKRLNSFDALNQLHDTLVKELNAANEGLKAAEFAKECANPFPPPPFPGNNHIVPITSAQELAEEGREMEHCVYSSIYFIRRERCYIYRVLSPERATVSIKRLLGGDEDGAFLWLEEWGVDELKGKRNDSVSAECERTVSDWLQTAQISLSE